MNDPVPVVPEGRRRRRRHSDDFRAEVVKACTQSGVSIAAVAMANGLNANLVRRWVHEAETSRSIAPRARSRPPVRPSESTPAFVPMPLPTPPAVTDIRIEVRRGPNTITVTWPSSAAAECAAWIRELMR